MNEILDYSGTQLQIFVGGIDIDYSLPKYQNLDEKNINGEISREISKQKNNEGRLVDEEFFKSLSANELNILVTEEKSKKMAGNNIKSSITVNNNTFPSFVSGDTLEYDEDSGFNIFEQFKKIGSWFTKKKKNKDENENENEEKFRDYEIDIMKFFDYVKLEINNDSEIKEYYDRVGPYLVAIKNAQLMGQKGLVDRLTDRMFIVKYESYLRAKGFHHKISEEKLVEFVLKTEKGVNLTYVKNFGHPIPEEVIKKKVDVDSLDVFDNYVILHYDPDYKVYQMTREEIEEERKKKADPILFGLISGSTDLYYICDWIDEYCDLTLDKFLEVSGLDKKSLEIDEKVRIL